MNTLKNLREKLGTTQVDLAEKTGLSLRTIQRLETINKASKGNSLIVLSDAFGLTPAELQGQFQNLNQTQRSETLSIKLINLSALACVGIPFGNLIVPIILWNSKRESKVINEVGKKIINFQILWTIMLSILLIVSPFINQFFLPSKPLILIVLVLAFLANLLVITRTAISIQRNDFDFLDLPIRLL